MFIYVIADIAFFLLGWKLFGLQSSSDMGSQGPAHWIMLERGVGLIFPVVISSSVRVCDNEI